MLLEIDIDNFYDHTSHSAQNGYFFSIKVNGTNIATSRTSFTYGYSSFAYLKYYVDVPDSTSSISMDIQAWEDGPSSNVAGDDLLLRLSGTSTCVSPTYNFNSRIQPMDHYGNDIIVHGHLSTYVRQKTQTAVITGTDGTTSYGLDQKADDSYRYNADQQVYVLHLNIWDTGDSHFTSGLNTIILPRSVALQSQLNYTFEDLANRLSGTILAGAGLYSTNTNAATSSGSVIMEIYAQYSNNDAEQLLTMLTHDPSGKRIGDNVTFSGAAVYSMHLPYDVLRSVGAADISNSPFGGSPQYLSWGMLYDYFVALVTLPYTLAVSAFNFIVSVTTFAVSLGLQALGSIAAGISDAVSAAETAVVNAFNAFVAWAINYFSETINSVLGTISNTIGSLMNGQFQSMLQFSVNSHRDVHGTGGNVSSQTKTDLHGLVYGDFFWVLVGAATLASLILLGFQVITFGFGFLTSIAVMMIAGELLKNAINYVSSTSGSGSTDFGKSTITDELDNILGSNQNESISEGAEVFDACFGVFAFGPEMGLFAVLKDKMDFALTISMTLLAFMNLVIKDSIISVITLGVSLICLAKLYCDMAEIEDRALVTLGLLCSGAGITISGICLWI